ncbi:MAG: TolC family protein [Deltaproteobacteria bacterium]|nr:TolC family protein [Deltaproteobacteria bacterium]
MPKLSTSYNYSRLSEPTTFWGIPINVKDNYQWKGTITQPIFTGFELTSSYRLAELGIDESKLDFEQSKLDLVLKVKKAYFQILIADKSIEVTRKDVESRKSAFNTVM